MSLPENKNPAPASLVEIIEIIDRIARKARRLREQRMRAYSLTPVQFDVLALLCTGGPLSLKDLADARRCAPATITDIVDGLEKKSLVTRVPHPSDRRSQLVTLTGAGRKAQGATLNTDNIFEACCPAVELRERIRLRESLLKLDRALRDSDGEDD